MYMMSSAGVHRSRVRLARVARRALPVGMAPAMAATVVLPTGTASGQFLQSYATAAAAVDRDGLSTGFTPSPSSIPVAINGTVDRRAHLEFSPFGFGLPAGAVLVGVTLDVDYQSVVGDSVLSFHSFPGDGAVDFFTDNGTAFDSPFDLTARWQVDPFASNAVLDLDPGPIFATLATGQNPGLFVLQENTGASTTLAPVNNFEPRLTLEYLDPAAGNGWIAGNGDWATTSNWSDGFLPNSSADAFIQPAGNAVVQAPDIFSVVVRSLTLGGGAGEVTLRVGSSQQFNVASQTTLFPNATLDLNLAPFVTRGLHLHPGATIDWNDGIIGVEQGFLSHPVDEDFVVNGVGQPLLVISNGGRLYQNTPQSLVLGDTQDGILLVAGGGEVRVRNTVIGQGATGSGTVDIQNNDAVFDSRITQVGPDGNGTVKVRNGGVYRGGAVFIGGTGSNVFNPVTTGRFEVGPGGTAEVPGFINAVGSGFIEVAAGAAQSPAQLNTGAISLYGDATSEPELLIDGANASVTITDRINLGLGLATQPEGTGRLTVRNGGTLDTDLLLGSVGIYSDTGDTTIVVEGDDSTVAVNDSLFASFFGGQTDIRVTGGPGTFDRATLSVGGIAALGAADATAQVNVLLDQAGYWEQTGELFIAGFIDPDTNETFDGGTVQFTIGTATGSNVYGGLDAAGAVRFFAGATVTLNDGHIEANEIYNERGGTFEFEGGELYVERFIGDLEQHGGDFRVDYGDRSTVEGDYTLNAGGKLTILPTAAEFVPDSSAKLTVTGTALLAGSLGLDGPNDPWDDYDPIALVEAVAIVGRFEEGEVFEQFGSRTLLLTYTDTAVLLQRVLTGDANLNGQVEQGDLDAVLQNWGSTAAADGVAWAVGDLNGNGHVEQGDLDAVLQNWGVASTPNFGGFDASRVPEPAVLGALLPLIVSWRGRRGQIA